MALLELSSVTKRFGGLTAVNDVNISIEKGSLSGLIGPNGAGKTTIFNLLTGVYSPSEGDIRFDGMSIAGWKPYKISRAGVGRTFQNIRLFGDLSVLDNVRTALSVNDAPGLMHSVFRSSQWIRSERSCNQEAERLLDLLNLRDVAEEQSKSLPYGSQRRLEIARALATRPKLLLLDEPAAGMNPQESADLMLLIRRLRDEFDVTILLIEHDMNVVMQVCEQITVMVYGKPIAHGTPSEIRTNTKVIEAYLGTSTEDTQ